jgi:K+/H+ antiporter YhaU regulatory subunit KhtT
MIGRARYEEIAQDLCRRIAQGELLEGARVLGRSSLAGTYQVSPETIRRAVAILHERGIVQSVAGSGIRVVSKVAAAAFLESLRTRHSLEEGARELRQLLRDRHSLDEKIENTLDRVLSQTTRALSSRHVEELTIPEDSWAVGRSLGEIRLRSRTGATAVALTRTDADHFSPAPDMQLFASDVLTVVGSDDERQRARTLLASPNDPGVIGP